MPRTSWPKVHKINLEALRRPNVAETFAGAISSNLNTLDDSLSLQVNEHWIKCAGVMNKAATKHLKNYDPGLETSGIIINAKRSAMSRTKLGERCYKPTPVAIERTSKGEAYKLIRKKKRQQLKDEISNLENLRNNQEIRKFYKNLNRHRNGYQIASSLRQKRWSAYQQNRSTKQMG